MLIEDSAVVPAGKSTKRNSREYEIQRIATTHLILKDGFAEKYFYKGSQE
jgi:hypothetical protein